MTAINSNQKISKRSLTFNKSFLISIFVHIILILGITLTTYYQLPIFKDSPIINVKFANSNEDFFESFAENKETKLLDDVIEGNAFIDSQKGSFQTYKVKKLMANSKVNTEEAVYLNLWQRRIEKGYQSYILIHSELIQKHCDTHRSNCNPIQNPRKLCPDSLASLFKSLRNPF